MMFCFFLFLVAFNLKNKCIHKCMMSQPYAILQTGDMPSLSVHILCKTMCSLLTFVQQVQHITKNKLYLILYCIKGQKQMI